MLIAIEMRVRGHELHYKWEKLEEHDVLEAPIKKLQLSLKRSPSLQNALEALYEELARKGLIFRPKIWLSDEWFSPEGLAGFAIPFYLAHPRLTALEKKFTGIAEGASPLELMKLLRHECGHAIDTAYRLRLRRKRQQIFGPSTKTPYRNYYTFKKGDPNFVLIEDEDSELRKQIRD